MEKLVWISAAIEAVCSFVVTLDQYPSGAQKFQNILLIVVVAMVAVVALKRRP